MFCCNHDYSWLGLALEVRSITDVVITLVEDRTEVPERRRNKIKRQKSKNVESVGPQMLLFPVDTKTRKKFEETARLFEYYLKKNNHSGWRTPTHDLASYELFDFVHRWGDSEWEPQLAKLHTIGQGEIPTHRRVFESH